MTGGGEAASEEPRMKEYNEGPLKHQSHTNTLTMLLFIVVSLKHNITHVKEKKKQIQSSIRKKTKS